MSLTTLECFAVQTIQPEIWFLQFLVAYWPIYCKLFVFNLGLFHIIFKSIFQVKAGTIFDNMLVTDSEEYAQKHGEETWGAMKVTISLLKQSGSEHENKKIFF